MLSIYLSPDQPYQPVCAPWSSYICTQTSPPLSRPLLTPPPPPPTSLLPSPPPLYLTNLISQFVLHGYHTIVHRTVHPPPAPSSHVPCPSSPLPLYLSTLSASLCSIVIIHLYTGQPTSLPPPPHPPLLPRPPSPFPTFPPLFHEPSPLVWFPSSSYICTQDSPPPSRPLLTLPSSHVPPPLNKLNSWYTP